MEIILYENDLTLEDVKELEPNRRTVRAIIQKGDKYSISFMHGGDVYMFIGGGIDKGEDIIEALKRECLEEAGFMVEPIKHICTIKNYSKRKDSLEYWNSNYYLCKIVSEGHETNQEDYEIENGLEIRWFTKAEMIDELTNYPTTHSFGRSIQNRDLMAFNKIFE